MKKVKKTSPESNVYDINKINLKITLETQYNQY